MPRRSLCFASLALAATLSSTPASAQRAPDHVSSGGLAAAPGAAPLRAEPDVDYGPPPAARRSAWQRFVRGARAAGGSSRWHALWDRDTRAPTRVFGGGIPAPGVIADADAAVAHARATLLAHRDLLAPGSHADGLRLVASDLDRGLRTVAFTQEVEIDGAGRAPVIGGQVSFRYRNDRLFALAAEALPVARLPAPSVGAEAALIAAQAWIAAEHATATLLSAPDLVALPLVRAGRTEVVGSYRVVLDATSPRARWAVYVDARSGSPIAREQLLRFDQATVLFDVPVRAPQLGRALLPAAQLEVNIDGAAVVTGDDGLVSWSGSGPTTDLTIGLRGPVAKVQNFGSPNATTTLTGASGGTLTWSLADDETGDAQIASFVHAVRIKAHARTIAPDMAFLDQVLPVRPNQDDGLGCNAFWDGSSVNFLRQNSSCNNSARVSDVVYHEFGHAFHQHSVIAGAGALDGALGEGAGDTMAVSYTHDAQMAPGFHLTGGGALRDVSELRRWPEDIDVDIHETGLIFAGAMWDLRTYLVEDLGLSAGRALADQLFYQALRRSSSIPTTYAEVLAADDDDGDLDNGTPHICAINRAFVRHGLSPLIDEAGIQLVHVPPTVVTPGEPAATLTVAHTYLYPQCADKGALANVSFTFHALGGGLGKGTFTPDGDALRASLPAMADGSALRYTIEATVGGASITLPANPADPEYRVFAGEVAAVYCTDFEAGAEGFTWSDAKGGSGSFEHGAPGGKAGDPAAAFSGEKVIGTKLGGTGKYLNHNVARATSPLVSVAGAERVRLQFRRWLGAEHGDRATILVNDHEVWENAPNDAVTGWVDHLDQEWIFEDIDVSPLVSPEGTLEVTFALESDTSGQLGGWNVDDFCIMAWHPTPVIPGEGGSGGSGGGEPGPSASASDGGCGCALPGGDAGPAAPLGLAWLALTALAWLRRTGETARRRSTARGR